MDKKNYNRKSTINQAKTCNPDAKCLTCKNLVYCKDCEQWLLEGGVKDEY